MTRNHPSRTQSPAWMILSSLLRHHLQGGLCRVRSAPLAGGAGRIYRMRRLYRSAGHAMASSVGGHSMASSLYLVVGPAGEAMPRPGRRRPRLGTASPTRPGRAMARGEAVPRRNIPPRGGRPSAGVWRPPSTPPKAAGALRLRSWPKTAGPWSKTLGPWSKPHRGRGVVCVALTTTRSQCFGPYGRLLTAKYLQNTSKIRAKYGHCKYVVMYYV